MPKAGAASPKKSAPSKAVLKKAAADQVTAKMPGKPNPDMMPKGKGVTSPGGKAPNTMERLNFQKTNTAQKKKAKKRNIGRGA